MGIGRITRNRAATVRERLARRLRFTVVAALACAFLLFGQSAPETAHRYPSPDDMVVSPDGHRLYVVCSGTDELLAVDTAAKSVAGRVPVGRVPRGVAMTPDGKRLYVTNSWSDTVTEIDAATLKVLRTLPAGPRMGAEPSTSRTGSAGTFR